MTSSDLPWKLSLSLPREGKMGVPIKNTVVFEANIHNTHRKISEIMFANFFPPPTGVRYLVTWLHLNILLPFCVRHPLSLQTCFKTTDLKQKRMFTNKCYYKEYHFCYFLKKKYDSVCVCVRF